MVFLFADFVRISQNDAQKYDNPVESQPHFRILTTRASREAISLFQVSFRQVTEGPQHFKGAAHAKQFRYLERP